MQLKFSTWCKGNWYVTSVLNQVENNGIAHTVAYVESFIEHMKSIMTMLDAKNIDDLTQKQIVFSPEILSWIEQRSLNIHRG